MIKRLRNGLIGIALILVCGSGLYYYAYNQGREERVVPLVQPKQEEVKPKELPKVESTTQVLPEEQEEVVDNSEAGYKRLIQFVYKANQDYSQFLEVQDLKGLARVMKEDYRLSGELKREGLPHSPVNAITGLILCMKSLSDASVALDRNPSNYQLNDFKKDVENFVNIGQVIINECGKHGVYANQN